MEMSIGFPNIGIEFAHVGRSVSIFGYEITFYGILIAIGMILGVSFVVLEAKRRGQDPNSYLGMILVGMIFGLWGARLFYVGFSWPLYRGNIQEILNIRSGGLSIYGGIFGGVLGAVLFCRIRKCSFWKMADTVSIGLLIAQIIGRWGDFFNRGSFGEYTDGYFAMRLPLSAVHTDEVSAQMREKLAVIDGVSYIQAHPVFLYESVLCLLLLMFLLGSQRKKKFQGEIFMRYLALYGLIRCFTEWLRTDKILIPGTRMSVSLIVSVFLFLFFGAEALIRRSMEKKRAAARKRRREAFYAAEEEAEAELDRQEKKRAAAGTAASDSGEQAEAFEKSEGVQEEEDEWDGTLPSAKRQQEEASREQQTERDADTGYGDEPEENTEEDPERNGVSEGLDSSEDAESKDTVQGGSGEKPLAEPKGGSGDGGLSDAERIE